MAYALILAEIGEIKDIPTIIVKFPVHYTVGVLATLSSFTSISPYFAAASASTGTWSHAFQSEAAIVAKPPTA